MFTLAVAADVTHAGRVLTFSAIKNSINTEISARVMTEAYSRIGIDIEQCPGKRALMLAELGRVDGELFRTAGMGKEYPNLLSLPQAIKEGLIEKIRTQQFVELSQ